MSEEMKDLGSLLLLGGYLLLGVSAVVVLC